MFNHDGSPVSPQIDYVKVSCGQLLEKMIHDYDILCYVSGCEVKRVTAHDTKSYRFANQGKIRRGYRYP